MEKTKEFHYGQKVKIISGFYKGQTGTVVSVDSGWFSTRYTVDLYSRREYLFSWEYFSPNEMELVCI